ncbi:hypothetical protein K402DRAFT_398772 [Aulographum hederae CBS 113979]|uniref:DNA (cytosine-5-)-methyltransferase n=1 Tax=Aulographum hederae CBS 113979 TaxID=1176131 RepID=A0A6G1GK60_9PEZI|nr:hypothetical protein K402DRAFT_398772 [Aulographum hederae CBS 113979]
MSTSQKQQDERESTDELYYESQSVPIDQPDLPAADTDSSDELNREPEESGLSRKRGRSSIEDEIEQEAPKRARLEEGDYVQREEEEADVDDSVILETPDDAYSLYSGVSVESGSANKVLDHVLIPGLLFPKSQYDGWEPPLPRTREFEAVAELRTAWHRMHSARRGHQRTHQLPEYVTFDLSDFTIYRPDSHSQRARSSEMEPLHLVQSKRGIDNLSFDGILFLGEIRKYVQGVPFSVLAIEGYGDLESHTVGNHVCIQSKIGEANDIWFKLGRPSSEYRLYQDTFLWVADLAKHFVDYLSNTEDVTLNHFRKDFSRWIWKHHSESIEFRNWYGQFGLGREDFRTSIVANLEYLRKEWYSVADDPWADPFWKEVNFDDLSAVKWQDLKEQNTIVTPYVYSCFKDMYFAKWLEERKPSKAVQMQHEQRKVTLGFGSIDTPSVLQQSDALHLLPPGKVRIGDIVVVARDEQSAWKDASDAWCAYVQKVRRSHTGKKLLDVIWLYKPSHTTLANMNYPFSNELFFSDHCNCGDNGFGVEDVVGKLDVDILPKAGTSTRPFIRQKFLSLKHAFVTMEEADMACPCNNRVSDFEKALRKYSPNDAVLVEHRADGITRLEPAVVISFLEKAQRIRCRRLLRCQKDLGLEESPPNELVWTNSSYDVTAKRLVRKCHMRFFEAQDIKRGLPTPYDRKGNGNCFFIMSRLLASDGGSNIEFLSKPFPGDLNQGLDLNHPVVGQLTGLDLFCGGGNFGRGLEEGGALFNKYAVDMNVNSIHTYRANLPHPEKVGLFFGSVNDYLSKALAGSINPVIAPVGEINHISGGSPCQGMSTMQPDKQSDSSLRNTSLAANLVAFIDLYRPEYAILENVPPMARSMANGQNIFSQVLCALVGMGYQAQQFLLDPWSFGDAQSRPRLFISITAPGLTPIAHPALTHAHLPNVQVKKLGVAASGEAFGERKFVPTPFEPVTASIAAADLPDIEQGRIQTCIPFPDHRIVVIERPLVRSILQLLPKVPYGYGFIRALRDGYMSKPHEEFISRQSRFRAAEQSRSYSRMHPDRVFPAITTNCSPSDAFVGHCIHWDQPRPMTVLEARRAQGFPDHEVIVGNQLKQWRIIGNSVARHPAMGIGMALRDAVVANNEQGLAGRKVRVNVVEPVLHNLELIPLTVEAEAHLRAPIANGGFHDDEEEIEATPELPAQNWNGDSHLKGLSVIDALPLTDDDTPPTNGHQAPLLSEFFHKGQIPARKQSPPLHDRIEVLPLPAKQPNNPKRPAQANGTSYATRGASKSDASPKKKARKINSEGFFKAFDSPPTGQKTTEPPWGHFPPPFTNGKLMNGHAKSQRRPDVATSHSMVVVSRKSTRSSSDLELMEPSDWSRKPERTMVTKMKTTAMEVEMAEGDEDEDVVMDSDA